MSDDVTDQADTGQTPDTANELPDWAKQKVAEANAEAARYRVEKKDAVEAAKQAVTAEFQEKIAGYDAKVSEAEAATDAARLENMKLTAAVQALVPNTKVQAFAELLKGDDEAALASHAEELKELFGTTSEDTAPPKATDRSQGHQNPPLPLNGDRLMQAVQAAVRH